MHFPTHPLHPPRSLFLRLAGAAFALVLCGTPAWAGGGPATAAQSFDVIINGGFEQYFQGWQTYDIGLAYGRWIPTSYTFGFSSQIQGLPPAYQGSIQAECDEMNVTGSAHTLYQDVGPPAECASATLKLTIWVINQAVLNGVAQYASPDTLALPTGLANQQVRVDIVDPAAPIDGVGPGVLLNLFRTMPGDPATIPYTTLTADLTPFRGRMVRLRIAEANTKGTLDVGVDAVSLICQMPSPATATTWGRVKDIYR